MPRLFCTLLWPLFFYLYLQAINLPSITWRQEDMWTLLMSVTRYSRTIQVIPRYVKIFWRRQDSYLGPEISFSHSQDISASHSNAFCFILQSCTSIMYLYTWWWCSCLSSKYYTQWYYILVTCSCASFQLVHACSIMTQGLGKRLW